MITLIVVIASIYLFLLWIAFIWAYLEYRQYLNTNPNGGMFLGLLLLPFTFWIKRN